jgi:small conductance mechanosensitive channel
MRVSETLDLLARKLESWVKAFVLHLPNLVVALLLLVLFWLLARVVRHLATRVLGRVSHSDQVTRLLSNALFLAIVGLGLFVALGVLGLDKTVASLLAGAGILGIALGFALQDVAANVMAGVFLAVERPFRHGHLVETKDHFGAVVRVSLRWTELLTPEGQHVLIPNKEVFGNPLVNFSLSGRRRVDVKVGVTYGEDLERAREIARRAVEAVPSRLPDTEVEVFWTEFASSSIDLVVRFWIRFTKQPDYLQARSEAIEALKTAFAEAGITIPYPIHVVEFGGKGGGRLAETLSVRAAGERVTRDR